MSENDKEGTISELIEALDIFKSYGDKLWPTHCEHDVLLVTVDPEVVSDKDKARLDALGFFVGEEYPECFTSFRFGSA